MKTSASPGNQNISRQDQKETLKNFSKSSKKKTDLDKNSGGRKKVIPEENKQYMGSGKRQDDN